MKRSCSGQNLGHAQESLFETQGNLSNITNQKSRELEKVVLQNPGLTKMALICIQVGLRY